MSRDTFNAVHAAHEKWLDENAEHSPDSLQLRKKIAEIQSQMNSKEDWRQLAQSHWGTYNEFNGYYTDKLDENNEFTEEAKHELLQQEAEKRIREEEKEFERAVGRKGAEDRTGVARLEEKRKSNVIEAVLQKHELLKYAVLPRGNWGKDEVITVRFHRDPEAVIKGTADHSEIYTLSGKPEQLAQDIERQIGVIRHAVGLQ